MYTKPTHIRHCSKLNTTMEKDPLLSILTSLETKTTAESNDATEEPIEADFLEELQSHTRGI